MSRRESDLSDDMTEGKSTRDALRYQREYLNLRRVPTRGSKCGVPQLGMISVRHTGLMARFRLQEMAKTLSKSGNTANGT